MESLNLAPLCSIFVAGPANFRQTPYVRWGSAVVSGPPAIAKPHLVTLANFGIIA